MSKMKLLVINHWHNQKVISQAYEVILVQLAISRLDQQGPDLSILLQASLELYNDVLQVENIGLVEDQKLWISIPRLMESTKPLV